MSINLLDQQRVRSFFDYIYERQAIWHKRFVLKADKPWTNNEWMQTFKFCNVFRELDACTIHLWNKVLKHDFYTEEEKVFNALLYRVFNTRTFFDDVMGPISNPHATYIREVFVTITEKALEKGVRLFTNAYLVAGSKWDPTIRKQKHKQFSFLFEKVAEELRELTRAYKSAYVDDIATWLTSYRLIGPFLAYQVALDLSYTGFFPGHTEDDFVVIGPGAKAGLELMSPLRLPKEALVDACKALRDVQGDYLGRYPDWEEISAVDPLIHACPPLVKNGYLTLSAIEFCLCEWRKLSNWKSGHGRVKYYKG